MDPAVSLKQARQRRDAAKRLLTEGKDPKVERKSAKRAARLAAENDFETISREFVKTQGARWSASHAVHVLHRLQVYAFADLGHRPIADITPLELLDVIRRIEARGVLKLLIA